MTTARYHNGRFKTQPGLTMKRLECGAVELVIWQPDGTHQEPIVVSADDWVESVVAVTAGAEQLAEHDKLLRQAEIDRIHAGRE